MLCLLYKLAYIICTGISRSLSCRLLGHILNYACVYSADNYMYDVVVVCVCMHLSTLSLSDVVIITIDAILTYIYQSRTI